MALCPTDIDGDRQGAGLQGTQIMYENIYPFQKSDFVV